MSNGVKMPSKRKRVIETSVSPRKVGRFTISNANPETMSKDAICKRMEEFKKELKSRGFYKTKSTMTLN